MTHSFAGPFNGSLASVRPTVMVSVGTDHHPFDRLVGWLDDWAAEHPEVTVIVQRGTARATIHTESFPLIPHGDLCRMFASATAVVVHGGPSTVMDARAAGRLPIVVPRDPELGEHIDDHQVRFSDHLARHGLARVADSRDGIEAELAAALSDPNRYTVPVEPGAVPGLVAFGKVADGLLGVVTGLTPGSARDDSLARRGA